MDDAGGASRRLRLDLAYEGTRYAGFGVQPGRLTIQEVLEEALSRSLGERVRVTPAGRTDAGVHASQQVVSFATHGRLQPDDLLRAVNARLPRDVLVHGAADMPPEFDARRSALRRQYRYLIWNHPLPTLWWRRLAWHVASPLDAAAMDRAARALVGTRDFASFAGQLAREPEGRSTMRTVEQVACRREGEWVTVEITANAFLRHMVRGIVGTLVQVGRGRLDDAQFSSIVAAADRRQAGPNAPPHGLMLVGVEYPEHFRVEHQRADQGHAEYPMGRSSVTLDAIGGTRVTGAF